MNNFLTGLVELEENWPSAGGSPALLASRSQRYTGRGWMSTHPALLAPTYFRAISKPLNHVGPPSRCAKGSSGLT